MGMDYLLKVLVQFYTLHRPGIRKSERDSVSFNGKELYPIRINMNEADSEATYAIVDAKKKNPDILQNAGLEVTDSETATSNDEAAKNKNSSFTANNEETKPAVYSELTETKAVYSELTAENAYLNTAVEDVSNKTSEAISYTVVNKKKKNCSTTTNKESHSEDATSNDVAAKNSKTSSTEIKPACAMYSILTAENFYPDTAAQGSDNETASRNVKKIERNKEKTARKIMICVAVAIVLFSVVATLCFAYTFVEISKLKKDHTRINEAQNTTGNNMPLYQNCLMLENKFQQIIDNLGNPGHYQHYPAASCAAALLYEPSSPSGHYWVGSSYGSSVRVFCDMTRSCANITGGWIRVAELDMTNGSTQCPTGLRSRSFSNIRTCERDPSSGRCSSVTFFTSNIEFSRVCGKLRAYPIGETSAFSTLSIDTHYVDGISLTHGRPRRHIWTFAAAFDDASLCPCNNETIQIPGFVEKDYFCDAGNIRDGDPLWDGEGCSAGSTCCSFNNPPWFYKQLPQPTTDDIEMRVCRDGHYNEDVVIETVDIYIQ